MPRSLKLFLGAVTALPIVLFGYLFVRFVNVFIGLIESGGSVQPDLLRDTFYELMGIQLTTLAILVALLGFYLWHLLVVRARRQIDANLAVWVLALLFVPIVAMPIYWFVNIWPETDCRQGRSQPA